MMRRPSTITTTISLCVGLVLAAAPCSLLAQQVFDSVRRTDLNDYAFGVAMSASSNPFAGAETSTIVYPYLTALEHPAFNKNWFTLRDSDIGVRYVTDNEWEFGFNARVQTLGLGASDSEEVIGLVERQWTVEAGPMIGWRRFPVNLMLKAYWDLLGRHDGHTTEVAFSLPREFAWGYLVPSVEFRLLSEDYAGYYYGVQPEEASPSRPEYEPGSAINPFVALRVGYRLGSHWMITGKVGVEFLESAITDSPIVDRDRLWSTTIGLAYNADLFQTREYDPGTGFPRSLEFRFGVFSNTLESTVQRYSEDGRPGEAVSVESVLGVPERDTTLQADLIMRFAFYHRLEMSYFEFGRRSTTVLDRDLVIGDEIFLAGTEVDTSQDTRTLQLVYGYSLWRDAQKELGVSAGLHYTNSELTMFAEETSQRVEVETEVPLPTIGAFASVTLANRWSVQGEARAFALEFDRYEGAMGFFAVRLERDFGRYLAAGIGFNYYSSRLESRDASLRGVYKATRYGPLAYVAVEF
jgi:outer membrane scaffolding protein for murein synthesis (MipA/OmpV family)